ncbi:hypothetical protein Ae406Ps2_6453c [Pseudonocardia sp. Ae406_Ps2]|nr:hypothetical protein Ae406Ps2_6447c [Pseudonocardia sp. Ae406_Ps2]OLL89481.1 hypothetical protein Ae406Ps2_6453c [Pseudonocardia sp. Ae406_Ps2]
MDRSVTLMPTITTTQVTARPLWSWRRTGVAPHALSL